LHSKGGPIRRTFALGDVEAEGLLEPNAINSFAGRGGVALFLPLGRPTTWRVIAMAAGNQAERQPRSSSGITSEIQLSELQALVDLPTEGTVRLSNPAWLTRFHLHHRQTVTYRVGNVFLAGDAAHIHSPVGGQGMNTGIQDAWNLGWKIGLVARDLAYDRLLDTYDAERWPVGQFLLRYTDRLFSTLTRAMSDHPLATWARRVVVPHVVPHLFSSRAVRRTAFAFVSELGIRYRKSPAVAEVEARPQAGPRAGDRLPDAEILVNGHATYLQDAVAGPRHALLLCGDPRSWDPVGLDQLRKRYGKVVMTHWLSTTGADGSLRDRNGNAFLRLGVRDAAQYLVRPDGYIALRSAGRTFEPLDRYLAGWYVAAP
jgi:hypothetical protein